MLLRGSCRRAGLYRSYQHRNASTNIHGPIAASDTLTQLKSVFQAFASRCTDVETPQSNLPAHMKSDIVPRFLEQLHEVEPRTRRASHAMYAWRVRCSLQSSASTSFLCGSSNGGEAGAGERLERLLELGRFENVIVVVFRWYGGVKLGSNRWKCISSVAKDALDRGRFLPGADEGQHFEGSSRKGRRR